MQPKEGEPQAGSLAEYVSLRVKAIEDARRAAAGDVKRQLESQNQQQTLLRKHGELATPIEELFDRFQVRETLEEAQAVFCKVASPLPVQELNPKVSLVADPRDSSRQKNVSRLERYGLQLVHHRSTKILEYRREYDGPGDSWGWPTDRGPGYGVSYERGRPPRFHYTELTVSAKVRSSISVMAIRPEGNWPGTRYDLECILARSVEGAGHFHFRPDEENVERARVEAGKSPEVFKRIIGDHVVKILTSPVKYNPIYRDER